MKLAQRLTLALVLVMCAVLLTESWFSAGREMRLYTDDTRHDEHVTGQAFAVAFSRLWSAGEHDAAQRLIEQANQASGQSYVRWVPFGPATGPLARLPLSPASLVALERGSEIQLVAPEPRSPGRFFTYVPVRAGGVPIGALELSESLARTRDYVRSMYLNRLATVGVLAGICGLVAMLFGVVVVGRPIRSLVENTRRIAAGDLAHPLGSRQRDEIGALAGAIDDMCEQLARARERITAETTARLEAVERMRHADRLATVGKLASGVAHELGTPLNVTSMRASMIASGEVAGAAAADSARVIEEQAKRMTSVIRQLLDFARRQTPRTARHNLRLLARQTLQLLAPLADRRGVRLCLDGDDTPAWVEVDAGQIQQALTNLVVNAVQASARGGGVWIRVGTRAVDGPDAMRICDFLEVEDGGEGILPEHLTHVFDPFFTTKDPGVGTGLGLAVAYGIARDHGGWITVVSAPGKGSRFTIHLPRERPSTPEPGRAMAALGHVSDGVNGVTAGGRGAA